MPTRAPVAHERILRGSSASLSVTVRDQYGEPATASGVVTARVQKADGTDVIAAGGATTGTNPYLRALTAAQAASVDMLLGTWTDAGDASTHQTLHEIVGGFYFAVADLRAFDTTLQSVQDYSDEKVRAARTEVEDQCELITGCSFVPRYRRVRLDGSGHCRLQLPDFLIRTVRSVRFYSGVDFSEATADELAAITFEDSGTIFWSTGTFPCGLQNVLVEYEYGYDRPPQDLQHQNLIHARHLLNMEKAAGVTQQAESFTFGDGGVFRLAVPGRGGFETGIPSVDAVYDRYNIRVSGIA